MGTRAVIFDIAYTPYRLKSNATAAERDAHAKERVFYDMSGTDNIYKYMTTESKQTGAESKRFTMLEYLQKSTGVFNQNGMLSKEEVKAMKKRAQTGEKVLWHGFISFNKENSNKIDSLEKCIELVRKMFRRFFEDSGFESDNMDLMCALHLDRPEHLHIHYCFWEKEAKVKNKRAAGYIYRKKGKIPFEAIEKMTERLNAYVLEEDFAQSRRERAKALYKRSDFTQAKARDIPQIRLELLSSREKGVTGISSPSNLTLIPKFDNRSKREKTYYELVDLRDNSAMTYDTAQLDKYLYPEHSEIKFIEAQSEFTVAKFNQFKKDRTNTLINTFIDEYY